jgi:hypothetical protein
MLNAILIDGALFQRDRPRFEDVPLAYERCRSLGRGVVSRGSMVTRNLSNCFGRRTLGSELANSVLTLGRPPPCPSLITRRFVFSAFAFNQQPGMKQGREPDCIGR